MVAVLSTQKLEAGDVLRRFHAKAAPDEPRRGNSDNRYIRWLVFGNCCDTRDSSRLCVGVFFFFLFSFFRWFTCLCVCERVRVRSWKLALRDRSVCVRSWKLALRDRSVYNVQY